MRIKYEHQNGYKKDLSLACIFLQVLYITAHAALMSLYAYL